MIILDSPHIAKNRRLSNSYKNALKILVKFSGNNWNLEGFWFF
uniref:Uncharacterized protein n=1 Tax=Rhizophora mucronata TaxID=61149 RepID=A0A2P2NL96_RHIMU